MLKDKDFFSFIRADVLFHHANKCKMPTIVGTLTLMSMINFVLCRNEHEKSCINSGTELSLLQSVLYLSLVPVLWLDPLFILHDSHSNRERSGSMVECLTRDRRAAGSSLTGVIALCP